MGPPARTVNLLSIVCISLATMVMAPIAAVAARPAAVPSGAPPPLHPAGRYFATPDGNAVYLAGDHTWTDGQDVGTTRFDYSAYLDFLSGERANLIRLWVTESQVDGSGNTVHALPYAKMPDGRYDLSRFNQAYFDNLHARVRTAGAKGIYVSIMLFNGWSVRSDGLMNNPWNSHPFNAANNINGVNGDPNNSGMGLLCQTLSIPSVWAVERKYIAKVVQTVAGLPNVLFEVSNESTGSDANFAWQNAVVDYIKQQERIGGGFQHPVGMTATDWFNVTSRWHSQDFVNSELLSHSHADWISPAGGSQYRSNPPDARGGKVVIVDTDHVFGIGGDASWVWKQFIRGYNVLIMDDMSGTGLGGTSQTKPNPDRIAQEASERLAIAETRQISTLLDLATMKPSDSLSSTGYALADPANGQYVVYAPSSGTFTVDLSAASGRVFDLRWMEIGSGKLSAPTTIRGGSSQQAFSPRYGTSAIVLTPQTSDGSASAAHADRRAAP